MKTHIMIAVPAYAGTVRMGTNRAITADMIDMMRKGWSVTLLDEVGCADIYDSRARMCTRFLNSPASHLMLVDWDVVWKTGSIAQLVNHKVDFVCGVYPMRKEPVPSYAIQYLDNDQRMIPRHANGLMEVAGISAGFMCLHRNVVESMTAHYKDDPVAGLYERDDELHCALWDPYRFAGTRRKLGEDYAFCQRWRDMGGKVWIDPTIPMAHVGERVFAATFIDFLEAKTPPGGQRAA